MNLISQELMLSYFLFIILAYLMGSIPSSIWIGRLFYNKDVRNHGSGNAGFTNAIRVLGAKGGIPVLIIDILKGFFAVKLVDYINIIALAEVHLINFKIVLSIIVLLGHLFPLFANFKGGKGVATLLGATLAIVLYPVLSVIGVFLLTFLISRIVSLSSLVAALSFPLFLVLVFGYTQPLLVIYAIVIFIILVITHWSNIQRLLRREEAKVKL